MKSFLEEGVACMDLGKNVVTLSIGNRTYLDVYGSSVYSVLSMWQVVMVKLFLGFHFKKW